jgi:hypothetical protein
MTSKYVERQCIYCNQVDDHPKHERILPGFISVYGHMDCCAQATECELCVPVVEAAEGKRGEDLRAHIMDGKD